MGKTITGGAVKYSKGYIEGYLVRFTSKEEPDLTGEYFTKDTNFGEAEKLGTFFDHGTDKHIKKIQIGTAKLERKTDGIYAKAKIEIKTPEDFKGDVEKRRKEYEEAIKELAAKGFLGWSSGAAGHLVERMDDGDDIYKITQWPLAEASLTPTPAETKNMAEVKSILGKLDVKPEEEKAVNLSDKLRDIINGFTVLYNAPNTWDYYVNDVYDEFIIVCYYGKESESSTYFKVSYTETEDGYEYAPKAEWIEGSYQFVDGEGKNIELKKGSTLNKTNVSKLRNLRTSLDKIKGELDGMLKEYDEPAEPEEKTTEPEEKSIQESISKLATDLNEKIEKIEERFEQYNEDAKQNKAYLGTIKANMDLKENEETKSELERWTMEKIGQLTKAK